jgi:predicted histone-like DNA-binding protein
MMAGAGHLLRPQKAQETDFPGSCDLQELLNTEQSMINYSIVMRSVNANLLEINQAKSRINQAKKDGKEPDKKDTDLVKTEKQNAFAISQYTDVMTIEKFAKHITSHGSVYSRADISAILYMAVDCMREMLLEGKKIRLGDLGDFSLLLSSKGAETADKFTAQNITNVKVQWDPGQQFKNLLDDAEFNLVASRSAQAAVIKAIKEGKTNVDLNVPETPDGGGDGDGTTGGGTQGGGTQGGGSNAGGSGTTGTEGSGSTGDQGTSGGNTGGEDGGGDNVNF